MERDIRKHITEVKLRRGTEAELKLFAGRLLSATMDRSRPLWDFTLVHGLKGDRTALIVRVHHCLADGISGVGMLATVMDSSPVVPSLPKPAKIHVSRKTHDSASLFVDGLVSSFFSGVQRMLTAQSELLEMAQQLAHSAAGSENGDAERHTLGSHMALPGLAELQQHLPDFASAADRMPFNVVCRGPQHFEWASISLSEIKAVKRCHGATVNDVFLTLLAAALRRYSELHRAPTKGRLLRMIVPVSIRGKDKARELGNRITFFPVAVPFVRSSRQLIRSVTERTTFLKKSHVAELVGLAGTLLGAIPTPVQAMLCPIASALPIPVGNVICTQVPGPREPLYFIGHRLISCYPYVPLGGELGMNCAILTYNDTAHFGFSGDVHAIPDLHLLPKLLMQSFEELKKVSGLKTARRPKKAQSASVVEAPSVLNVPPGDKQPASAEKPKVMSAMAGD